METLETSWGTWWLFVDARLNGYGAAVDADMVVVEDTGDRERNERLAHEAVRAWVIATGLGRA